MKRWLCVLLICFLLTGCGAQQPCQKTVFAMDTVMELQVWAPEEQKAQAAVAAIADLFAELEKTWSVTDEASFLSALNRGEMLPDEDQQALLDRTEALSVRTRGAFDPKLHSVIGLWGFLSGEYRVPASQELTAAAQQKQWNLGAALKGYAGEQAVALLEQRNVDRAILNLGGNIQTFGSKPDGKPWQIGIQDPDGSGNAAVVSVEGTMAVVTSGDYQRYFTENGVRYHHILNPKTGYPAQTGLKSVTVICRDGLTADALSTALYVMGVEEATKLWRESDDFEAVFLLKDGRILATAGAVLSGCEFEVIGDEK